MFSFLQCLALVKVQKMSVLTVHFKKINIECSHGEDADMLRKSLCDYNNCICYKTLCG